MNICVVIPVYNEAEGLKNLIPSIQKNVQCDILVVNDASKDDSGRIAKECGVEVLNNESQSGKGFCLKKGFKYVIDHGYDGALTMDGDGQHLAEDISQFLQQPEISSQIIINGNRMNNAKEMPMVRLWTNKFMSSIISLACRKSIPDTQCGFRFIGSEVIKAIELNCNGFEIETEILMKANKKGFVIQSVDIQTVYRDEQSKINPFIDTFRFFSYFFKELFS